MLQMGKFFFSSFGGSGREKDGGEDSDGTEEVDGVSGFTERLGVTDAVEVRALTMTTTVTNETQKVGLVEPRSTKQSRSIEEEGHIEGPERGVTRQLYPRMQVQGRVRAWSKRQEIG